MKLISLNVEGYQHLDLIYPFFERESAEVICLTEVPEDIQDWLILQGYKCSFAPMCIKNHIGNDYKEGILIATKSDHLAETIPYFDPNQKPVIFDHDSKRTTQRHLILYVKVEQYNIATTHFTWNPVGEIADENQTTDMENMLAALKDKPAHILCGDLNIPRHQNKLYEDLTARYSDEIPQEYNTSLDKSLHRHGQTPKLKKIFDSFMVDYLFTQPPYTADNTKLVFGLSDHAAVISNVYKND